jgi:hypothetical protein
MPPPEPRPERPEQRTEKYLLRMSPAELRLVQETATSYGISQNSAICLLIVQGATIAVPYEETRLIREHAEALSVTWGTAAAILISRGAQSMASSSRIPSLTGTPDPAPHPSGGGFQPTPNYVSPYDNPDGTVTPPGSPTFQEPDITPDITGQTSILDDDQGAPE